MVLAVCGSYYVACFSLSHTFSMFMQICEGVTPTLTELEKFEAVVEDTKLDGKFCQVMQQTCWYPVVVGIVVVCCGLHLASHQGLDLVLW